VFSIIFFLLIMFISSFWIYLYRCLFFFSSRSRHTRFSRDWSSDVCSSDLDLAVMAAKRSARQNIILLREAYPLVDPMLRTESPRSEERRVGKECRTWYYLIHYKIIKVSI